jgi:hypothetical protein
LEDPDGSASSTTEQRLLVSGVADLRGARTLVSGVEEIDTSPEDPIVHLSSPLPGRGISGRDSLLVVSIVTAPGSTPNRYCLFIFFYA